MLKAMSIGIGETNVRGVTERIHKSNEMTRAAEDGRTKKRTQNAEVERQKAQGRRARRRHVREDEERNLERTIWDLTNFSIKAPRKDFLENAMPILQERIRRTFPGNEWF